MRPAFDTLYLAYDSGTALLEKRATFGDPANPSIGIVQHPTRFVRTTVFDVDVDLRAIVDLTDEVVQSLLDASAQELTGDWDGYRQRTIATPITGPSGVAPSQRLAAELFAIPGVEGARYVSSRAPTLPCLVVFTGKLSRSGSLRWQDPNTGRQEQFP